MNRAIPIAVYCYALLSLKAAADAPPTFTEQELRVGRRMTITLDSGKNCKKFETAEVTVPSLISSKPSPIKNPFTVTTDGAADVQIRLNPNYFLQPGKHTASVLAYGGKGLRCGKQTFEITVDFPSPAASELSFWVTRSHPFSSVTNTQVTVPFRNTVTPCLTEFQPNLRQSALVRKEGGFGLASLNLKSEIESGGCNQQAVSALPIVISGLTSAGQYSGDFFVSPLSENAKVKLNVYVRDGWYWPVLVMALGIALAFAVRRYLGVLRQTLGLRREESGLTELLRQSQSDFNNAIPAVQPPPTWANTLPSDLKRARLRLVELISSVEHSPLTAVDDSNPDWKAARDLLQSVQLGLQEFGLLGKDLAELSQALESANNGVARMSRLLPNINHGNPAFTVTTDALLSGAAFQVETMQEVRRKVDSAILMLSAWSIADDRTAHAFDRLQVFAQQFPNNAAIPPNQVLAVHVWRALWQCTSADEVNAVLKGSDLNAIDQAVWDLEQANRPAAPNLTAARGSIALRITAAAPPRAALHHAAKQHSQRYFQRAIAAGDVSSLLFAWSIAIVTGLQANYLGKPFGTVNDYATVFVWAAATKATLDMLSTIADKLIPQRVR